MLRGREAVRADRRLRTDEKAIRAQSAILYKSNLKPNGTYLSLFGDELELFCGSELARDCVGYREQARSHAQRKSSWRTRY